MATQPINIPKLGAFLGIVAAVAAGLLSLVYATTEQAIQENLQKKTRVALEKVLPEFDNVPTSDTKRFSSAEGWDVTYYIARQNGIVVGFAGEVVSPEGFPDGDGDIKVMVGLDLDGTIGTVIVTDNSETPGLGSVVAERKTQKTITDLLKGSVQAEGLPENKWLDWYTGKMAGPERWEIVKEGNEVNGKTGATITSKAILGAVHAVARTAVEHMDELRK